MFIQVMHLREKFLIIFQGDYRHNVIDGVIKSPISCVVPPKHYALHPKGARSSFEADIELFS